MTNLPPKGRYHDRTLGERWLMAKGRVVPLSPRRSISTLLAGTTSASPITPASLGPSSCDHTAS